MSTEAAYEKLKALQVDGAHADFWVFRHSTTDKVFTANFVKVTDALKAELVKAASEFQVTVGEHSPYGILDEPNENSALSLDLSETNFSFLEAALNQPPQECELGDLKKINSSVGYVLKVEVDGSYVYFIKKVHASWSTKAERSFISAMFDGGELGLASEKVFYVSRGFDFVAVDGHAFVYKKRSFESLLKFKGHYEAEFASLCDEEEFVSLFQGFDVLKGYVGSNSIQLKRMAVVKERQYYKDGTFMSKVKEFCGEHAHWGISFAEDGAIQITEENVRSVVQCLLDLRLRSDFSGKYYDAPFARPV